MTAFFLSHRLLVSKWRRIARRFSPSNPCKSNRCPLVWHAQELAWVSPPLPALITPGVWGTCVWETFPVPKLEIVFGPGQERPACLLLRQAAGRKFCLLSDSVQPLAGRTANVNCRQLQFTRHHIRCQRTRQGFEPATFLLHRGNA